MSQAGDQSPARITMAQAALLNMQSPPSLPPKQARHGSTVDNGFVKAFNRSSLSHPLSLTIDPNMAYQTSDVSYGPIDVYDNKISRREEGIPKLHTEPAISPTVAKARNGYTPAEELILAAHAHAQQLQARGVPAILSMNSDIRSNHQKDFLTSHISGLPGIDHMSHTGLCSTAQDHYVEQERYPYDDTRGIRSARERDGMGRIPLAIDGLSISRPQAQGQHPNSRLTTLPLHAGSNRMRHNVTNNSRAITSYDTYDIRNKHNNIIPSSMRKNTKSGININTNRIFTGDSRNIIHGNSTGDVPDDTNFNEKEENGDSPLVSPALTYTSHGRTPQTLSPVTPFFGSFTHGEAFEDPPLGVATQKGKERAITTVDDC
jgi:hypothetical protein